MLGHGDASGGDDEGGGRGDVKGIGAVSAGAHDLQGVHVVEQAHAVGAHPGGAGGDLVDGLPLDGQGGQEGGHLNLAGLAAHNLIHDGGGGLVGKVLFGGELDDGFFNHGLSLQKMF